MTGEKPVNYIDNCWEGHPMTATEKLISVTKLLADRSTCLNRSTTNPPLVDLTFPLRSTWVRSKQEDLTWKGQKRRF